MVSYYKAPIFQLFDLKCHIQIKTNTFGYTIGGVLSQLILETSLNKIVAKADLG